MPQSVIWAGTGVLIEQAGSPSWEFAEVARCTQIFRGDYGLALGSAPRRGYLGTGALAGLKVEGSTVVFEKGGIGLLTITYTGVLEGDDQVPADEFEDGYDPQEFPIESHPYFAVLDDDTIRACKNYAEATDAEAKREAAWVIVEEDVDPQFQVRSDLAVRLNRGKTNFRYNLPVFTWTSYWTERPPLDPGQYLDTPTFADPPTAFDYVRLPDRRRYTNGFWALTRSWQAVINFDTTLYPVT